MSVQEKSPMPAETTGDKDCIWFIFLFYALKFNTLPNNLCQEINFEEKKIITRKYYSAIKWSNNLRLSWMNQITRDLW